MPSTRFHPQNTGTWDSRLEGKERDQKCQNPLLVVPEEIPHLRKFNFVIEMPTVGNTWIVETMHRLLLTSKIAQSTELPNMDGTAEYGRGHDGSPQDGYRGTRG